MDNKAGYSEYCQLASCFLRVAIIILSGLILPLILVTVVKQTGFTEIFEEILKALVVFFLILKLTSFKESIRIGILFGFLFGVSETFLYFNNICQLGDFNVFWQRVFLTVPMHIITVLIILLPSLKSKKNIIWGTLGSIAVHLLFNRFI